MKLYSKLLKSEKAVVTIVFVIIAGALVYLTYPGYMYMDTYSRISFAEIFPQFFQDRLHGYTEPLGMRISYMPGIWMMVLHSVSGEWGLYIFFQSFLFLITSYWFGKSMCYGNRIVTVIIMIISPIYLFYSVYWESSVGTITLIMLLILVWREQAKKDECSIVLLFLGTFFAIYTLIGYRVNAVTIIPALIVGIMYLFRKRKVRIWLIGGIIVGYIMLLLTPRIINIDTMNTHTMGMIWEMVSIVDNIDDSDMCDGILDPIGGEGATERALVTNTYKDSNASVNSIWWGEPFEMYMIAGDLPEEYIKKAYIALVKAYPMEFIKVKSIFAANTLGFNGPLCDREYYYNRDDFMYNLGMRDSAGRHFFFDIFMKYNSTVKIHRYPWIFFATATILYALKCLVNKKMVFSFQEISLCTALCYYGAFLINTQAFEFRYFFPAWVLLTWYIVGGILELYISRKKENNVADNIAT